MRTALGRITRATIAAISLMALSGAAQAPAIECGEGCWTCQTNGFGPLVFGQYCSNDEAGTGRCDCTDGVIYVHGTPMTTCSPSGQYCFGIIVS